MQLLALRFIITGMYVHRPYAHLQSVLDGVRVLRI